MANLEIKLTLDGSNDEMVDVTGKLLSALGQSNVEFKASASATTTAEESDDSEKKNIEDEKAKKAAALKAKKAAEAKAKKEAEAKAAKEAAENAEESEEGESSDDEEPSVTIEQIKSMMAKKISDHRDVIKKQMTKIGAQNLSTISADQYDSFYSFLEGLD